MIRVLAMLGLAACGYRAGIVVEGEAGTPGEASVHHDAAVHDAVDAPIDARPDAPLPVCDQRCTNAGGTCTNGVCVFDVTTSTALVCPSGLTCQFDCNTTNACKNGIDCATAAGCVVNCNTSNTCQTGVISCGSGGCTMYCRGSNTCDNSMYQCGTLIGSCDLECCGSSTCVGNTHSGTLTSHTPGSCP